MNGIEETLASLLHMRRLGERADSALHLDKIYLRYNLTFKGNILIKCPTQCQ